MNRTVAALYVEKNGVYSTIRDVCLWTKEHDARFYNGPWPVVAHPPCHLWVNLAAVNWARHQRQLPAWYPGGSDGGCFAAALAAVRRFGGVLEHPAYSHAWEANQLSRPSRGCWSRCGPHGWVTEVSQSAYGHRARKRTWLYVVGAKPPDLDWRDVIGSHQISRFDLCKPVLKGREASATPVRFAKLLLQIARRKPNFAIATKR